MDIVGLNDVRVTRSAQGYDLVLDASGRLGIVRGADKLIVQVLRAIYNSEVLGAVINMPVDYFRRDIFYEALERLRRVQVLKTHDEEPDIKGFNVYVSEDGVSFRRLNLVPLLDEFVFEVENEIELFFRIEVEFRDGSASFYTAIKARATEDYRRQRMVITDRWVMREGNGLILFRFKQKRFFVADELMQAVESIVVGGGDDPRALNVVVKIRSLGHSLPQISLELQRLLP
jgi:hypothetical protein